jgi:predicted ATPase/DNA-binding XRE family transcriptional regulator
LRRRLSVPPFGRRLKRLREAAGFTQEELATISGVSLNAISSLERGARRRPLRDTVRALAAALDLAEGQRDELLAEATRGGHARTGAVGTRVPHPLHALLGRDAEIKGLRHALNESSTRLVTITGPGGVGKTRLATEAALQIEDEGLCSVAFASLAPLGHASQVARAITEALGLGELAPEVLPRAVADTVRHRPTLLVLDNFEHVVDAAPLVAEVLAAAPELQVLATSRAPLRVPGEHERPLSPLARSPAGCLFLQRIRDVRPDYRPGRSDTQALGSIAVRLDALPLALELAAGWMRVLSPQEVLARLESGGPLPTLERRDVVERHRSLAAVVGWSYALLSADDQRFFRRLAILSGGCDVAMATAVGFDREDDAETRAMASLARLIEQGLLVGDSTRGCVRYRMLETVRAHAAELLAVSGEGAAAVAGLVRRCLALADEAFAGLFGRDQVAWLDRLDAEFANIRIALARLVENGRGEDAARILAGTGFFWLMRSHVGEGLDWCERVRGGRSLLPESVRARLLNTAAVLAIAQHRTARANDLVDEAVPLAEVSGDGEALALALHLRGFARIAGEDVAGATASFERSHALFREQGTAWGEGINLIGLGHTRLLAGDLEGADRLLRDAQRVLREAGSWWSHGSTFGYLGIVALLRGNPDECIALVLEGMAHLEAHHDRFDLVFGLVYLACACVDKEADLMAARILGALDAVLNATGLGIMDPATRRLLDRYEGVLRMRGDPLQLERARSAGRETPLPRLRRDVGRLVGG